MFNFNYTDLFFHVESSPLCYDFRLTLYNKITSKSIYLDLRRPRNARDPSDGNPNFCVRVMSIVGNQRRVDESFRCTKREPTARSICIGRERRVGGKGEDTHGAPLTASGLMACRTSTDFEAREIPRVLRIGDQATN